MPSLPPRIQRAMVLVCIALGALASVLLTWQAGRRNPSVLLLAVMSLWVLSPFGLLGLVSTRLGRPELAARPLLFAMVLAMSLAMPIVYDTQAPKPANAPAAFLFVIVPPISCIIIACAFGAAAWHGRTEARRNSQ